MILENRPFPGVGKKSAGYFAIPDFRNGPRDNLCASYLEHLSHPSKTQPTAAWLLQNKSRMMIYKDIYI